MLTLDRNLLTQESGQAADHQRVEVLNHSTLDVRAEAEILGIDQSILSVHALNKGQSSGIQRTGRAVIHHQNIVSVLIRHLKRSMEELAGVEGTGFQPLHLHHQEHGKTVSGILSSTGAHHIQNRCIVVLLCKLSGSGAE